MLAVLGVEGVVHELLVDQQVRVVDILLREILHRDAALVVVGDGVDAGGRRRRLLVGVHRGVVSPRRCCWSGWVYAEEEVKKRKKVADRCGDEGVEIGRVVARLPPSRCGIAGVSWPPELKVWDSHPTRGHVVQGSLPVGDPRVSTFW